MTDESNTVMDLREAVARFVAEREWQRFHNPKNLSMALVVEAAELVELFQWKSFDESDTAASDPSFRQHIEGEIADIAIFLLAFCNSIDLQLAAAIERKLASDSTKYPADEFKGRAKSI